MPLTTELLLITADTDHLGNRTIWVEAVPDFCLFANEFIENTDPIYSKITQNPDDGYIIELTFENGIAIYSLTNYNVVHETWEGYLKSWKQLY